MGLLLFYYFYCSFLYVGLLSGIFLFSKEGEEKESGVQGKGEGGTVRFRCIYDAFLFFTPDG